MLFHVKGSFTCSMVAKLKTHGHPEMPVRVMAKNRSSDFR